MIDAGNSTKKSRCYEVLTFCKSRLSFTMYRASVVLCHMLFVWFQAEETQLNSEQKLRSRGAEKWHIYRAE